MDFADPVPVEASAPTSTLLALKQFVPSGRGPWTEVPDSDWNDWRWQMRNRVTSLEQLERFIPRLTREERAGALLAGRSKLAVGITPHFFSLIDPEDPNCPIRRQVIPASRRPTPPHGRSPIPAGRTPTRRF